MTCKHKSTKLNNSKDIYYNSIKQQTFVYTQLNDQTVLFQKFNQAQVICLHSVEMSTSSI